MILSQKQHLYRPSVFSGGGDDTARPQTVWSLAFLCGVVRTGLSVVDGSDPSVIEEALSVIVLVFRTSF